MTKTIILNITPQTHVRTTQGDRIFFRIPRENLRPSGLKRLLRIERYNKYKIDLLAEAKRHGFVMPYQGLSIKFMIPVPKSWSKKKKRQHHMMLHCNKPDLSNILKAVEDSLCQEDKYIAHYGEIAKYWVDFEVGWIELTIQEPTKPIQSAPA